MVKALLLNASKLHVYKLNQTTVSSFVVGVELAHARSAASNYFVYKSRSQCMCGLIIFVKALLLNASKLCVYRGYDL
jgi:hypothetical protein